MSDGSHYKGPIIYLKYPEFYNSRVQQYISDFTVHFPTHFTVHGSGDQRRTLDIPITLSKSCLLPISYTLQLLSLLSAGI